MMKCEPAGTVFVYATLAALLVLALATAGCAGSSSPSPPAVTGTTLAPVPEAAVPGPAAITDEIFEPETSDLTGVTEEAIPEKQILTIAGSTTVLPIARNAVAAFMATHPNADIQISGGGSGVGIRQAGEKTVDIGMSSRELKSTESAKYAGLVKHVVARDGVAIIANLQNTIPSLGIADVRAIYTGTVPSWTAIPGAGVPGASQQIVLIGRESASGTREFFDSRVLKGASPAKTLAEKESNDAVIQAVLRTPGAIGYVSTASISDSVKVLPIYESSPDFAVVPSQESVQSGEYPLRRDLYLFTNGQPAGLAAEFIAFLQSAEGRDIIQSEGFSVPS